LMFRSPIPKKMQTLQPPASHTTMLPEKCRIQISRRTGLLPLTFETVPYTSGWKFSKSLRDMHPQRGPYATSPKKVRETAMDALARTFISMKAFMKETYR
jgi:hypothetical protein